MDVHCPQCDTLFEFDERQMRGAIATLKCSVCQHLFRIETHIKLGGEDRRRWMVRHVASGDVLYFSGFAGLHQWIMEGRVHRNDEISRTGLRWTRLAEIGEFSPVFEAIESIQSISSQRAEEEQARQQRQATIQHYPSATVRSPSRQPAPSWGGGPATARASAGLNMPPGPGASGLMLSPLSVADAAPSFAPALRLPEQPNSSQATPGRPLSAESRLPPSPHARSIPSPPPVAPPLSEASAPVDRDAFQPWDVSSEASAELYRAPQEEVSERPASRLNWALVMGALAVVVIGGAAWFAREHRTSLGKMSPSERAESMNEGLASTAAADEDALLAASRGEEEAESWERASSLVDDALRAGSQARDVAIARRMEQALEGALPAVHAAFDEASAALKEAASKRKSSGSSAAGGVLKRAQRALERGDSQEAYELFYEALDRDGRDAKALTGLGWTLIQMGKHSSAAIQFKRAISIDPDLISAYLGLAKAERNKGNAKGAVRIYEQFLERFPSAREANIARTQRDKLLKEIGQ